MVTARSVRCLVLSILAAMLAVCLGSGCTGRASLPLPQPPALDNPALPSVAGLKRLVTAVAPARMQHGADYIAAVAENLVTREGSRGRYQPAWDGTSLNGAAYALYQFNVPGYSAEPVLRAVWLTAPPPGTYWIGLANWNSSRWDWISPAADGTATFYDVAPYLDPSGKIYVLVLLLGSGDFKLDGIRLGGPDTAGGPVAVLAADAIDGAPPLTVNFDAGDSYQPGGTITQYEWDMDDDGVFEEDTGAVSTTQHVFASGGSHDVTLRVTGSSFKTATDVLTVSCGAAPTWQMTLTYPYLLDIDSVIWDVEGRLAVFGRNDASSFGDIVMVRAVDADCTGWETPVVVVPAAEEPFSGCTAALVGGYPAMVYYVEKDFVLEVRYRRALDAGGQTWSDSSLVHSFVEFSTLRLQLAEVQGWPALLFSAGAPDSRIVYYSRALDAAGTSWPVPQSLMGAFQQAESRLFFVDNKPVCAAVRVDGISGDGKLLVYYSNDLYGNSWALPKERDLGSNGVALYIDMDVVDGCPAFTYSDNSGGYYVRARNKYSLIWYDPVQLTAEAPLQSALTLGFYDGKPLAAYVTDDTAAPSAIKMTYSTGIDGLSWTAPETVVAGVEPGTGCWLPPKVGLAGSYPAVAASHPYYSGGMCVLR